MEPIGTLSQIMDIIQGFIPVPDSHVVFFGSVLTKPWPRRDIDICLLLDYEPPLLMENTILLQDLVFDATGQHLDLWTYITETGSLYHWEPDVDGWVDIMQDRPLSVYRAIMRAIVDSYEYGTFAYF